MDYYKKTKNELTNNDNEVNNIFDNIKDLVINSRNKVYQTVNTEMLNLYWNIGKLVMEIQQGDERASYGDSVLDKLSQKLTNEFGRGFSSRNLRTMRKFYLMYPIWKTVSAKLSWSHYLELIKIDEEPKRNFYFNECINSKWSVRELQRQRDSLLYERLTLSADKEKILELSEKGQILKTSKDLVKDPIYSEPDRNSVLLVLDNNIIMRSKRKEESMLKDNTIQDKWEELNYLEKQVLTTIFDKGEISSEETAKIINRGKTTAVKMLNKLVDMNLIEWTGTSKADNKGRYIMKN